MTNTGQILAVFALSVAEVGFAAEIPTSADNCDLQLPPDNHGEITGQIIVYPRRTQISGGYTGCQSVWLYDGKTYYRSFIYYFDRGELRMMKIIEPQGPPKSIVCEYRSGKSLTANRDCRDLTKSIQAGLGPPLPSFPKGCHVEALKQRTMPANCRKD